MVNVCASVQEDNPQAKVKLVDYLSVQTNKPYTMYLTNIGMALPGIYGWLIFFSMEVVFENGFANFFIPMVTRYCDMSYVLASS